MPPPLVRAHLREQINLLKQEVEAKASKDSIKVPQTPKSTPSLEALIKDWVNGMVPDQRSRMYGISEIIQLAELKGRYKELPAKQMVATVLYKCGFTQIRSWKKRTRNRRYWALDG
jgi:hypothetical protein